MVMIAKAGAATGLGLLTLLAAVPAASAGVSNTFGDWTIGCTDGLACTASVFHEGANPITGLEIRRPVDPAVPPTLAIDLGQAETPVGDIAFAIDGAEPIRLSAGLFKAQNEGRELVLAEAEGGAKLRAAMRDGKTIRVAMETAGGKVSAEFPLKGLAASLRFMDEAQRRDGTTAAFVATGDKPAPDPAKLPKDIANRSELPAPIAALWRAEGCDDVDEGLIGTLGFSTPLEEGRFYGLICGSPGAYNVNYALFTLFGEMASAVPFPGMSAKGPIAGMTAMNIDWDDRARRISSFGKGRGLGDCGIWQSWSVGDDGSLTLIEAREKDDCDGNDDEIDQWPKLWPLAK